MGPCPWRSDSYYLEYFWEIANSYAYVGFHLCLHMCFYVPVVSLWHTCLLLKAWSTDQQRWRTRELEKYSISGPSKTYWIRICILWFSFTVKFDRSGIPVCSCPGELILYLGESVSTHRLGALDCRSVCLQAHLCVSLHVGWGEYFLRADYIPGTL